MKPEKYFGAEDFCTGWPPGAFCEILKFFRAAPAKICLNQDSRIQGFKNYIGYLDELL
jgi:hypothetical protein